MPGNSINVGATNVPRSHDGGSGSSKVGNAFARIRSTCACSVFLASASMTGPTSVASRRGSPTESSRIAPFSIAQHVIGDVVLHAQHAQRRAALPGAVERGREGVGDDLLGQCGAVDDHRVLAAGLGDQHRIVVARGELPVDEPRDLGRAGEDDAGDARIGDERGADVSPRPGSELQRRGAARRRDAGCAPPRARSAASARRASRAPDCRRRARRSPAR